MCLKKIIVFLSVLIVVSANYKKTPRRIPAKLKFGAATSAYQVEGAWNKDGKSENIWDRLLHRDPCFTPDCSNADIATNSYKKVHRDVEMMREIGLDYYRLSISWARLLPTGFPDKINMAAVAYYNRLINEMIKYNIEPIVTLYHWDHPQSLQDMGGFINPYIEHWFADYARVCFDLFGDRVKNWITINEPYQVCFFGYESKILAPATGTLGVTAYLCYKNVLLAHARAWHMYDEEYRPTQNGSIGISIYASWGEPVNEENRLASEDYLEFEWGVFANPIFSETGDFPERMKKTIHDKSIAQGFYRSRLPDLSHDEIQFIKGTSDFFGLNHYSSYMVYRNESLYKEAHGPSIEGDCEVSRYQRQEWIRNPTETVVSVPPGFYKVLTRIREAYNNPPVFVTEVGYSYTEKGLNDPLRITFITEYLNALLDAMDEGSNIIGFTVWSLMDNFQWNTGYSDKYGLYEVDLRSPERTRTPRRSAFMYKEMLRTRILGSNYVFNPTAMTIEDGHRKRFVLIRY